MGLKGNSGKASRKKQLHRLTVVIFICSLVILVVELTGFRRNSSISDTETETENPNARARGPSALRQRHKNPRPVIKDSRHLSDEEKLELILSARVHLKDISIQSRTALTQEEPNYGGVVGHFCSLNWNLHKEDPSKYPMFRDLVSHSPSCDDPFAMDLSEILPLVRTHDVQNPDSVHAMYPAGFVFHESRCGSTLAANSLAAMDPDKHRVYSESNPSITALKACGTHGSGCPPGRAAQLIRDVLYLMGRTDDVLERRLFFKIQSIGTKSIHVMREAFPDVPWVFIYREPVQVMMSQIANGVERANCVRQMRDLDPKSIALMKENGKSLSTLESEDKCALHLNTLCQAALNELEEPESNGMPVNYNVMVNNFSMITSHFGMDMTDEYAERIEAVGSKYSKGRGHRGKEWKDDSEKKDTMANEKVKDAADEFLSDSYDLLEEYSKDVDYYLL